MSNPMEGVGRRTQSLMEEKDLERGSTDELDTVDATALGIQQLIEEAAANNTSITAPWSLVLNGPEEEAYQATLISRHTVGFLVMAMVFCAYGLKRAVVMFVMGRTTVWSGIVADIIYFTNCGFLAALVPWMLYLRLCCEPFAKRRVIRNTVFVACLTGYVQMWAYLVGSGNQAVGDHLAEFNYALWTGTALTVMPLLALSAGLSFHWNALGYIGILASFNCSPVVQNHSVFQILVHSMFHFVIVLGTMYALEAVTRNSFLVNIKNVGLIRKERESTKEAQRMSASFSRTVSTIAHDMKTPLAAIKIGVDLTITLTAQTRSALINKGDFREHKPFGEVKVILESMHGATQIALTCLEGLSASAALLDRGDKVLEPKLSTVSIPEVVKSALGACKLWSTSNVRLTSSVQDGLTDCSSSETMLVRNLLNLVTNAIKHTAEGCVEVYAGFKVFVDQPGDMFVEFRVSDTGTGVCNDYLGPSKHDQVWLPFESGAKSTGLGLFVVKRQCEALGGRCGWLANEPHGSVFWFAVPFVTALVCEPENGISSSCAKGYSSGSSGLTPQSVPPLSGDSRTVLIIDDMQAQLVILKLQFKSMGFEKVKTAAGGVAGLLMLQQEKFSVVFCDYNMPGMNGNELVYKFREWERVHRVGEPLQAIYGLTGENTPDVVDSCKTAGMQDVFSKPLETSKALKVLNL